MERRGFRRGACGGVAGIRLAPFMLSRPMILNLIGQSPSEYSTVGTVMAGVSAMLTM